MEENVISAAENKVVQEWVDKLAEMNNSATESDIITWAHSIPIKPIAAMSEVPLYLYGDATIDKAIVNILQGDPIEPNAANIYNILKDNFRMKNTVIDEKVPIGDAMWNPEKWSPIASGKPLGHNPVCKQEKTGDCTGSSQECRLGKNPVPGVVTRTNLSRPDAAIASLRQDERLAGAGFEVMPFDQQRTLISNENSDFIVDNISLRNGIVVGEDERGESIHFNDLNEFVDYAVSRTRGNFSKRKMFSVEESKDMESIIYNGQNTDTDGLISFKLYHIAHVMNLFANDLLYIHHHAIGKDFDSVHEIMQELYEKATEDVDALAEMALRFDEQVGNLALSAQVIDQSVYHVIETGNFTKESMGPVLAEQGGSLLDVLRSYDTEYPADVHSALDDMANKWETEINYKNKARLKFSRRNYADYKPKDALDIGDLPEDTLKNFKILEGLNNALNDRIRECNNNIARYDNQLSVGRLDARQHQQLVNNEMRMISELDHRMADIAASRLPIAQTIREARAEEKRLARDKKLQEDLDKEMLKMNNTQYQELLKQQATRNTQAEIDKQKYLMNNKEYQDLLKQQATRNTQAEIDKQKYLMNNKEYQDLLKQQAKNQRKIASVEAFKDSLISGMVDSLVNELPDETVVDIYDKAIGNKLMDKHPMLDSALYHSAGFLAKNKSAIGDVLKAGLKIGFSNKKKKKSNNKNFAAVSNMLIDTSDNLIYLGFPVEKIATVIDGSMFSGVPINTLSVDNLTHQALHNLCDTPVAAEKMYSRYLQSERHKKNFANENYSEVEVKNMGLEDPIRLQYSMDNPRYEYQDHA